MNEAHSARSRTADHFLLPCVVVACCQLGLCNEIARMAVKVDHRSQVAMIRHYLAFGNGKSPRDFSLMFDLKRIWSF